jgi:RsiW-degrading membrane proteinase PrsW (M82 family)
VTGLTIVLIYIIAALLPAYFLLRYIYRHDAVEKEPPGLLLKLFVFGILAAIPAGIFEYMGEDLLKKYIDASSPLYSVTLAFLVVAVVEEGVKYMFLKLSTWNNPNFNYRFDGVVYAVFVSVGFAAIENIMYIFSYGLSVALPRALLAVPAHMGFAVFMGAFYGSAQVCRSQGRDAAMRRYLFLSYLLPVFLHGLYDACAMLHTTFTILFFYAFVIIMYIIVIRRVKLEAQRDTQI